MTILAFALFLSALILCLTMGWSAAWAIGAGAVLFALLGLRLGYEPRALWRMAWEKGRKSLIVLRILVLIGMITGLWRASGSIAYCVYYGTQIITPSLFVLLTFLLTALLSYALGTAFGVASTAGVIFMALARSGGVDEAVAAGAILSGIYFGDRCSPVSSSANLVAAVTDTRLYRNVRRMFATGLPAIALTVLLYLALSVQNPVVGMDTAVVEALHQSFALNWLDLLPAVVILVLPLCRVPILWAMAASVVLAALEGWLIQGIAPLELLEIAIFGYQPHAEALVSVMAGGGLLSMASTCAIVLFTGLYSGILEGIGILEPLQRRLVEAAGRFGRLPVMIVTALVSIAVFCNQTVAILLCEQLLSRAYPSREELAMDIENSGITLSGMVPWSISCTVPLTMMGAGYRSLLYALLLWMIPLCYLFCKRWFYPEPRKECVQ